MVTKPDDEIECITVLQEKDMNVMEPKASLLSFGRPKMAESEATNSNRNFFKFKLGVENAKLIDHFVTHVEDNKVFFHL